MNRRRRRAAGIRRPIAELERAVACPDCNADVYVTEVAPGVYRGVVAHDETCPWFTAFRGDGGIGVRLA